MTEQNGGMSKVDPIRRSEAYPHITARSRWADFIRWPVLAGLALLVAACAVGPDFVPQPAPIANTFIGANSRSVKSASENYRDWWKSFRDPTLNQLIHIAYNQNLTLLSAGTRVLQARAVLGVAIGSFYPQVQQGTGSLIYNQRNAELLLDRFACIAGRLGTGLLG
jgi:hypothetical protein